mmetsp:Transcript_1227/g.1867  ORF Transcript_1227/g.1867 Transcript_1227/m.1867 type:complete len:104 (+) Transcript_1227:3-314(+)
MSRVTGRSVGAAQRVVFQQSRNAHVMPQPLSWRMDSLLIQCLVAAVIYFAPQDIAFLAAAGMYCKGASGGRVDNVESAFEHWKETKGLDNKAVLSGNHAYLKK